MTLRLTELRKKLDAAEATIPEAARDTVGIAADLAITADDSEGSVYGIDDVVLYRYERGGDRYGVALFLSPLGEEWDGEMHEIADDGQVRRVRVVIGNAQVSTAWGRSIENDRWKLALTSEDAA